jgi:hypothetical protein
MTREEIDDLTDLWDALTAILDYQQGCWYEFSEGSPTMRAGWHEIDETRARAIMRDLGVDVNADQRMNREVESLRPLTIIDLFRHRDGEARRRAHGKTKEQAEKDERAEESRARLIADAQMRLLT